MITAQLSSFSAAISETYNIEEPSTFWTCRPHFERLLGSGFLADLLSTQLGYCLSGQGEVIQAATGSSARVMLPSGVQIDILLLDPTVDDDKLLSYPSHVLMGFASASDDARLVLERYRHVEPYRNDVFDGRAMLEKQPDQVLRPMDVSEVSAGWEVFRLRSVDRPIPLVLLQSKPFLDFAWQYDPGTLMPMQAICPNSSAYRLFYTTKLLGEVTGRGNIESLLRISEYKSHFVRWSALQALFAVDAEAGRARLAGAVDDPHPRIRGAAKKALARLG
ncbi:hypothetical protein BE04_47885 [Sorangium cellulosum]|uniref:HEAT repeat domain-containing protein n=1 Tax=Sorangium cellulosum TaxID=56 RepID=A0A150P000_SORCE|nr:hypothetical protein BE04_47885 [Sorangium cellulosum]